MCKLRAIFVSLFFSFVCNTFYAGAYNPIIQTMFTADPAPMVYNDTLFVYTTHDEQTTENFFTMRDWQLFSTTDMVNWTAHGTVASLNDFTWTDQDNGAWAAQCIERNGKFYLYCPLHGNGIGVLVADSPYGPFTDPLGRRFISGSNIWDDIDPTVFIDDDGQAYLYWGNPNLYYVKLNEDMISFDTSIGNNGIVSIEMTPEAFGAREGGDGGHTTNYEEGPWLFKRNGIYYMVYAAVGIPEYIAYSTAQAATGPWTYGGIIMRNHPGLAFTNHPGIAEYKGNSYFFYHSQSLPGGGGFNRSVCVEQFEFNADGSFPEILPTSRGIENALENLDPYRRVEAETMAWSEGLSIGENGKNVFVTNIAEGNYFKVRNVDFGESGASMFNAVFACGTSPGITQSGSIEIYLDDLNGDLIANLPLSYTGSWDEWMRKSAIVQGATGLRDVYFVFRGNASGNLFNFDFWEFKQKTDDKQLIAVNAMVNEYKIDTISTRNSTALTVHAFYSDGTFTDISSDANITFDNNDIVSVNNGLVKGIGYGEVSLYAEYNGIADTLLLIVKNLESELSVKELYAEPRSIEMFNGTSLSIKITAEFYDGHTVDVTNIATISNPLPEVATFSNGVITANSLGSVVIEASFEGQLGERKTTFIDIQVVPRNPFARNEAEDFDEQSGIQVESTSDEGGGQNIGYIENNDWIRFNELDFADGAGSFEARVASSSAGGSIEIRTGSLDGALVGTCMVPGTGGWQTWRTVSCEVSELEGVNDIFLVFKGGGGFLFNMNWWMFYPKSTSFSPKTEIADLKVLAAEHDKFLTGLKPGDNVVMFNLAGQVVKSFNATSQQQSLEGLSGVVIIQVKRSGKATVIKTVL